MDGKTILRASECDLRRLPLSALEAFVLSQVDGRATLEEIADVAGLEVEVATRLAERLVELGAAELDGRGRKTKSPPRRKTKAPPATRPPRKDPRAESEMPPGHARRSDPRVEAFAPIEAPRARAPSRSAIRAQRPTGASHVAARTDDGAVRSTRRSTPAPAAPKTKAADDVCELDQDAYANIVAFAGKLDTHDHYALLGLERTVERKAVKRAYFALAAQFHPDRYFKKKLGHARAPLERVFHRITEAHDVLTDRVRREAYDRTLPPSAPAPVQTPPPVSRRTSKRPPPKSRVPPRRSTPAASEARASRPKLSAQPAPRPVTLPPHEPSVHPPPAHAIAPPPVIPQAPSAAPPSAEAPTAEAAAAPAPPVSRPVVAGSMKRLRGVEVQRRVDMFVSAADEALKANDVISAANNYRLALQSAEDPAIRAKLAMVDEMAKERRFEICLMRARTAEREQRWIDAAADYAKAHSARPNAESAACAAYAMRMSDGDMNVATSLAELAVSKEPRNGVYRAILGEVYLGARLLERAAAESDVATSLAPDDSRVKRLAAAVKRFRK